MMKRIFALMSWVGISVLWATACLPLRAQTSQAADGEQVVSGVVRDRDTRKKLENVTVALVGTTVGTVTNAEGEFTLKIPAGWSDARVELSHLGYLNTRFAPAEEKDGRGHRSVNLVMVPVASQLDEVVIYGGEARRIVEQALRKVPTNYPLTDNLMTAFYRETIQKRHRYIGISEAMMDVYKTSYVRRDIGNDKVQLTRGRRLLSQRQSDTLAVKVVGGPSLSLSFDVAKNPDILLDEASLDLYAFRLEPSVLLDDRLHYVVSFCPRVRLDYALFEGKLFIDCQRLCFSRAEFALDLSDRALAVAAILRKKPAGLRFRPQEVRFLITYRQQGDVTCLHYLCNEIRFKCDWKRRLFASSYTARSEMVVVEREEHPDRIIARRDAFHPQQVFYDVVEDYWDEGYWKDYNIIEPTESLEHAVKKLRKNR